MLYFGGFNFVWGWGHKPPSPKLVASLSKTLRHGVWYGRRHRTIEGMRQSWDASQNGRGKSTMDKRHSMIELERDSV